MTITLGRTACTSASEFELDCPWRDATSKSTVPMRLVRTVQLELLVPGEIAQIQQAKPSEGHMASDRLLVLGVANGSSRNRIRRCGLKLAQ